MPYCNTLEELSKKYADDDIVLVCDGASWYESAAMVVPENVTIVHIPPYSPEITAIEEIWRELRTKVFKNKAFQTLEKMVDRFCQTINSLTAKIISSITLRS